MFDIHFTKGVEWNRNDLPAVGFHHYGPVRVDPDDLRLDRAALLVHPAAALGRGCGHKQNEEAGGKQNGKTGYHV